MGRGLDMAVSVGIMTRSGSASAVAMNALSYSSGIRL